MQNLVEIHGTLKHKILILLKLTIFVNEEPQSVNHVIPLGRNSTLPRMTELEQLT